LNETKAARYQRLKRRAGAAELASGGLVLGVVALTPVGGWLARWAGAADTGTSALSIVLFVVVLVAAWLVAMLPARLWLGVRLEGRYAASGAPALDAALATELQTALLMLAVALLSAGVLRASLWAGGPWWWALAGVALTVGLVSAVRGLPFALVRLTSARPLSRPGLAARLEDLAARARVPVLSITEFEGGAQAGASAFVAGIGKTRRIFVSAELVRDWSDDEIAVVVAHELAHHAHHDLGRAAALSAMTLTIALWAGDIALASVGPALGLSGAADLRSWPLLAIVAGLVWLAMTPVRLGQSRRQERKADEFALGLTGGTEAFATAIRRLGARHLAEERPSLLTRWLFHRHPSVAERLALASRFRTP
jgi:STE24 endopeptidase